CVDELKKLFYEGWGYGQMLAHCQKKWHYPKRTFDNHYKEAQEAYLDERQTINDEIMNERIAREKKAVKSAVMGRDDILVNLSKIGRGEAWKVGNEIIAPNASDRINAMRNISRMQGYDAPERVDHTTQGEKINKTEVVWKFTSAKKKDE